VTEPGADESTTAQAPPAARAAGTQARPTVVLLHGQPGGGVHWRHVVDRLPDSLHVLAEDRPGYGTHPDGPAGLLGNADAVIRRLDELEVERATIAGHSWGGGIALVLAERHPDRVSALALFASIGPGAVSRLDRALARPWLGGAATWAFFRVAGPIARRKILSMLGADKRTEAAFAAGRTRPQWRTFVVEQQRMVEELPAVNQQLATITAPTLVVTGDSDRVVPMAVADRLATAIPGARLRVLRGQGHALPLVASADVADAITELTLTRPGS
jgi:pimeloyl-ACP methyl ester carboxylesterase